MKSGAARGAAPPPPINVRQKFVVQVEMELVFPDGQDDGAIRALAASYVTVNAIAAGQGVTVACEARGMRVALGSGGHSGSAQKT